MCIHYDAIVVGTLRHIIVKECVQELYIRTHKTGAMAASEIFLQERVSLGAHLYLCKASSDTLAAAV